LRSANALGQPSVRAIALYAKAMSLMERAPDDARELLEESLALIEAGASDVVYANVHGTLAVLAARRGNRAEALRCIRTAIAYGDAIGDRPPMVGPLHIAVHLVGPTAEPQIAATLAGAVVDGWYRDMSNMVSEPERVTRVSFPEVRAVLGGMRFDAQWDRGAAMSYEDLIALALAEVDAAIDRLVS
jgi:hypothetical protein